MNWVAKHLPENCPADKVFESLLFERPIENIIKELDKNDREHLLIIAKQFAIKTRLIKCPKY